MARIGVDVGGTKIAAGLVGDDGTVRARIEVPTPASSGQATTAKVIELVQKLQLGLTNGAVEAVGLAVCGLVDHRRSVVLNAPHIEGWRDVPLAAKVRAATGLPTLVENDAHAAAWAECVSRRKSGEPVNFVHVTVGTGIGGAIVIGGELYRGMRGVAGEVGHMPIGPAASCPCGGRACWERRASGSALVKAARRNAVSRPGEAKLLLRLAGSPAQIQGNDVMIAARHGDPASIAAFNVVGHWLGVGLASLATVLDPGMFVIGGGVARSGDLLLRPTRDAYSTRLLEVMHRMPAPIKQSLTGVDAGVVGAALLATAGEGRIGKAQG